MRFAMLFKQTVLGPERSREVVFGSFLPDSIGCRGEDVGSDAEAARPVCAGSGQGGLTFSTRYSDASASRKIGEVGVGTSLPGVCTPEHVQLVWHRGSRLCLKDLTAFLRDRNSGWLREMLAPASAGPSKEDVIRDQREASLHFSGNSGPDVQTRDAPPQTRIGGEKEPTGQSREKCDRVQVFFPSSGASPSAWCDGRDALSVLAKCEGLCLEQPTFGAVRAIRRLRVPSFRGFHRRAVSSCTSLPSSSASCESSVVSAASPAPSIVSECPRSHCRTCVGSNADLRTGSPDRLLLLSREGHLHLLCLSPETRRFVVEQRVSLPPCPFPHDSTLCTCGVGSSSAFSLPQRTVSDSPQVAGSLAEPSAFWDQRGDSPVQPRSSCSSSPLFLSLGQLAPESLAVLEHIFAVVRDASTGEIVVGAFAAHSVEEGQTIDCSTAARRAAEAARSECGACERGGDRGHCATGARRGGGLSRCEEDGHQEKFRGSFTRFPLSRPGEQNDPDEPGFQECARSFSFRLAGTIRHIQLVKVGEEVDAEEGNGDEGDGGDDEEGEDIGEDKSVRCDEAEQFGSENLNPRSTLQLAEKPAQRKRKRRPPRGHASLFASSGPSFSPSSPSCSSSSSCSPSSPSSPVTFGSSSSRFHTSRDVGNFRRKTTQAHQCPPTVKRSAAAVLLVVVESRDQLVLLREAPALAVHAVEAAASRRHSLLLFRLPFSLSALRPQRDARGTPQSRASQRPAACCSSASLSSMQVPSRSSASSSSSPAASSSPSSSSAASPSSSPASFPSSSSSSSSAYAAGISGSSSSCDSDSSFLPGACVEFLSAAGPMTAADMKRPPDAFTSIVSTTASDGSGLLFVSSIYGLSVLRISLPSVPSFVSSSSSSSSSFSCVSSSSSPLSSSSSSSSSSSASSSSSSSSSSSPSSSSSAFSSFYERHDGGVCPHFGVRCEVRFAAWSWHSFYCFHVRACIRLCRHLAPLFA
ncbi:hypothetical protein TGRUB_271145A [Toxoplasma gondii RUB]|uniref:Uncharacterized protein n=1 Tax=Toxoplasma gondii RUB TaxID=935652 RepID=A0A086LYI7_TOXGO|nr:hypothetical protein TGRUB_271145A [Toxoplasma gondii RUB]